MAKMTQEDALRLRQALEPLTHPMVGEETDDGSEIVTASMAVSLRRMADALEKQNKLIETLTLVQRVKR